MADLTQTAADVRATASTHTVNGKCGEAFVPGDWGYLNATDSKWYQTLSATAAQAAAGGMAMSNGALDTFVRFADAGDVDTGATGSVGAFAFVSANAGKMKEALPAAGEFGTVLGGHTTAANFRIAIKTLGEAVV